MTDVELQEIRREYSRECTPENLVRLLKATKRIGQNWQTLFRQEIGLLYNLIDVPRFRELSAPIQDFLRDETDLVMSVYPQMHNGGIDEVIWEFKFPRIDAYRVNRSGLLLLSDYRAPIRRLGLTAALSTGDPFVIRLCYTLLPVVQLSLSDSKITDRAVEELVSSGKPLRQLSLSGTIVTNKSLEYLARSNLALEKLDVRRTNIDWIAIEDYKQVKTDVEVFYA